MSINIFKKFSCIMLLGTAASAILPGFDVKLKDGGYAIEMFKLAQTKESVAFLSKLIDLDAYNREVMESEYDEEGFFHYVDKEAEEKEVQAKQEHEAALQLLRDNAVDAKENQRLLDSLLKPAEQRSFKKVLEIAPQGVKTIQVAEALIVAVESSGDFNQVPILKDIKAALQIVNDANSPHFAKDKAKDVIKKFGKFLYKQYTNESTHGKKLSQALAKLELTLQPATDMPSDVSESIQNLYGAINSADISSNALFQPPNWSAHEEKNDLKLVALAKENMIASSKSVIEAVLTIIEKGAQPHSEIAVEINKAAHDFVEAYAYNLRKQETHYRRAKQKFILLMHAIEDRHIMQLEDTVAKIKEEIKQRKAHKAMQERSQYKHANLIDQKKIEDFQVKIKELKRIQKKKRDLEQ